MPGPVNQLMPPGYLGPSGTSPIDPSYNFGAVNQLPTQAPANTYAGAIPTQLPANGPTALQMPHDYYNAIGLLKSNGQYTPQMDQWLQAMYMQRQGRA
jgi:hypothetical protein